MTSRTQPEWDEPCYVISVVSRMVGVNAAGVDVILKLTERIQQLEGTVEILRSELERLTEES